MKVAILLYYRSMAEYFMDLEDALQRINPETKFHYYVLYPCAWLALRRAGRSVKFVLPANASQQSKQPEGDRAALEKGVGYHEAILGATARPKLVSLFQGYKAYFHTQLDQGQFDGAILVGDSRLSIVAADQVAKKRNLPVLYWEQGPFQTTQLNEKGVNFNATMVDVTTDIVIVQASSVPPYKRVFKRSILSRLGTWATANISAGKWLCSIFPTDRVNAVKRTEKAVNVSVKQVTALPSGAYVYMLQVPYDNQIIEHGGIGRDVVAATKMLLNCIDPGKLCIRQHPLHKSLYPSDFYDLCSESGVCFADDVPYSDVLEQADGVIVANSTTGAEALAAGKKILVLGDAFYAHPNWSYCVTGTDEDQNQLDRFLAAPAYNADRVGYVQNLVRANFFDGHYLYEHVLDPRLLAKICSSFHNG